MRLHIYGALREYKKRKPLRLHMPGHKADRRMSAFFRDSALDVTELSFSDCLESPDGVIARAEEDIAALLGARRSHILTDGSTAGVFAMVFAAKRAGGKLAIARNAHKSVYNACAVLGVEPYILKINDRAGVLLPPTAADVEEAFKKERTVGGVLITSPDYYGNLADLAAIRKVCDRCGKSLYVDGAHGAFMRFDRELESQYAGNFADVWVDGAHKTLPTLTQGAIVSVGASGDAEAVEEGLQIFRTTSPSYPIMASVEYGVKYMAKQGAEHIDALRNQLTFLKARLKRRKIPFYEDSRTLVLAVDCGGAGIKARAAQRQLERRNIFAELQDGRYILFYFSPMTPPSALGKLERALCKIWRMRALRGNVCEGLPFVSGVKKFSFLTAHTLACEYVPLNRSVGRIAARSAGVTPPCYPVVVAGEQITEQAAQALQNAAHTFGVKDGAVAVMKIGGNT